MALVGYTDSSDSGGDDMSDTTKPSCPAMATIPPSPHTPKKKSKSNKRSIDICPTVCSMSRLNVEALGPADNECRSTGKDAEARDSPSPTKKRRMSQLSEQYKGSELPTSWDCRNSLFKVDENEEDGSFDDGTYMICDRVGYSLIQEGKDIEVAEKIFLDCVKLCEGTEEKKMAPKIGRSESDTVDAASLNNLVDGEVCANKDTDGKFKLAIRTENFEKIRSVQERKDKAEMDPKPSELLDEDMAESSEFAFGSENLSKMVQSVRERKQRTEMALKTFELLNDVAETKSSKEWKEMRSLIDGFKRVIMRLELEEKLQMALERKEGAEMYLKEVESLDDEVGTEEKETLSRAEIFKRFIGGRLEEDLQMLKETLETSFKRLEHLNDETETSFNKAIEARLSVDIASNAGSLEDDRAVRIPPANEDEVVTMEDIRDKIPEASTSTADHLTNQDSTVTQAGSLPSNTTEIPLPKDFNDENAMLQQALIQSHYDELLKSKGCACVSACSHRNYINKDTKPATVEDDEDISSVFLDVSDAEEEQDVDDESSDLCLSEFAYTAAYVNGEEKSGLDEKKRVEKGETMRDADEAAKSVNRVKEGLLAATAEQLKRDFIQMFQQECSVLTEDERANGVDEKLIEATATIVKRAFIHFNVDAFNEALTEASEEALAEAGAGASRAITSSRLKDPVGQNIFMKWEIAYPQTNLMRPDELMRAVSVLISFTRSTPYASAILKDTPESEYDALVVYIHYYLQMCAQVKCLDITEGGGCSEQDVKWRTDMPCFIPWWRQMSHGRKEEFEGEWNKKVLSKKVLNSVEADGGAGVEEMSGKF
ncbi:hypothetical protein OCU04_011012 [Sclerotinia nivalis]|uniref:Uncharacterized protein n=1 Tax=Sclerotinia nivalis TaxID=352851 RepID=A0A9X0DGE0_9HELO|nr:hypothetical protein OCU04_011012 [Sclerotinia nivalis]